MPHEQSELLWPPRDVRARAAGTPALGPRDNGRRTPAESSAAGRDRSVAAARRSLYVPADFARFAPKNVLDMLNHDAGLRDRRATTEGPGPWPGERQCADQRRAAVASKSETIFDRLARIPAAKVERIEIVDGATLGMPGLLGPGRQHHHQGRRDQRPVRMARRVPPGYAAHELSSAAKFRSAAPTAQASNTRCRWQSAQHRPRRGRRAVTRSPTATMCCSSTANGASVEFNDELPRSPATLKWDGPGSSVGNFNANYQPRPTSTSHSDEERDLVTGGDDCCATTTTQAAATTTRSAATSSSRWDRGGSS